MKGGFSFCGVDIYDLGLEYAPDKKDTYVYKSAPSKIQEQIFAAMDGGYFFGVDIQPKEFILRCFYTGKNIKNGLMTKVYSIFKIGTYGKLIFQNRDWCWYNATVTNLDITNMLNFENGFITITMKAYYPYAITDFYFVDKKRLNKANIFDNSAMLDKKEMMPTMNFGSNNYPINQPFDFLLYNPGTEKAKLSIEIAGNVNQGVKIINKTTGQECGFVGISKEITSDNNKYIVCDSMNGKTIITDGESSELAFLYHDQGFIDLESAYPVNRNIKVKIDIGSNVMKTKSLLFTNVVGKYIYIDNKWIKIIKQIDKESYLLNEDVQYGFNGETLIALLNEMSIVPYSEAEDEDNMSLTRLNFNFIPTFS